MELANKQNLWLLFFIPLIFSLMVSNVNALQTSITPSDDVFVYSTNPDKNFNYDPAWTDLQASKTGSTYWRTWLKFTIPSGLKITEARVYLYQWGTDLSITPVVTIHYSTDDSWNENTITWNNQPNFGNALDSKTISVNDAWYYWDVTSVISSGDTVSFVLKTETNDGYTRFCSTEYDSKDPYLSITYTWEEEELEVSFANIPKAMANALGISLFVGQLLASNLLLAFFLFPTLILTKGKTNQLYIILFVGLATFGFCVAIGWMPTWILLLICLAIACMWSAKRG